MAKHRAEGRPRVPLTAVVGLGAVVMAAAFSFVSLVWPSTRATSSASETVATPVGLAPARTTSERPQRLVVYGHSMPDGRGASDLSSGYAVLTAEAAGMRLVNRADGGSSAMVAARTMAASPAVAPEDVVLIHTGVNDLFRRDDDALRPGRDAIRQVLVGTTAASRQVVVLECRPVSWQATLARRDLGSAYEAWNQMLREEAAAAGADVLETCAAWEPARFTDPPQFHPNDEGHALIARELTALLVGQ